MTKFAAALLTATLLFVAWTEARAQYRPPPRQEPQEEAAPFEESVDLERFRKGHVGWDTQELLASGLTALHREHEEILKELRELRAAISRLQGELGGQGEAP